MPEMPEVETIRRDLASCLVNKKITSVRILSEKSALPDAAFFKNNLVNRKIIKIERRGKLLIFALAPQRSKPGYLLIHLKMTGQLIYLDKKHEIAGGHSVGRKNDFDQSGLTSSVGGELPHKHTRAIFSFSGGGRLFFNDLRRFGYLKVTDEAELDRIIKNNYGPEPLTESFSASYLQNILAGKRTKIKAALLDQKLIAGLGNIYVDESLYAAKIAPQRLAGSLRPLEIKNLCREINRIIARAIKARGTTFSNYVDSRGRKGNFSRFLKVYGRSGEKCPSCQRPIAKIKIAGRGTHYCPHCQK
jgi:formamidopyrimidine-DNA glycosylase